MALETHWRFFLILFHTIYKLDFTLNQLLISFSVEQICNPHSLFCEKEHHLLSSADKHRREEAKSHPQFIQTRLVICDVSETRGGSLKKQKRNTNVFTSTWVKTCFELSSYLYQGYTKFSRTNSNTCEGGGSREVREDHIITSGCFT